MEFAACQGTWTQDASGYVQCSGTLQVVSGDPFGLPPLTYGDASVLLAAVGALWALVWVINRLKSVIR